MRFGNTDDRVGVGDDASLEGGSETASERALQIPSGGMSPWVAEMSDPWQSGEPRRKESHDVIRPPGPRRHDVSDPEPPRSTKTGHDGGGNPARVDVGTIQERDDHITYRNHSTSRRAVHRSGVPGRARSNVVVAGHSSSLVQGEGVRQDSGPDDRCGDLTRGIAQFIVLLANTEHDHVPAI